MQELNDNRLAQASLAAVICGTRFKFFDPAAPGALFPTKCEKCDKSFPNRSKNLIRFNRNHKCNLFGEEVDSKESLKNLKKVYT